MGQQVYFAAEGIFNKSNNILMSSLGPGSPLWEKGAKSSVGYRSSRFTRQYFPSLTPFFAFFPHCGAWSRANASYAMKLQKLPLNEKITATSPKHLINR